MSEPALSEIRPTSAAMRGIRRIEVVTNPASGHTGPDAPEAAARIFAEFGLEPSIRTVQPHELMTELKAAVDAGPDLLVLIAGDGTAGTAASLCGPDGPLIAPLAGGTMNMLPHALYGPKDWKTALRDTLAEGIVTSVSGGEVDDLRFYVAAILGEPALWAEAREAVRGGDLVLAARKARDALKRAFSSRLRFQVGPGDTTKCEALSLMCPLVSRGMDDDARALEVAVLTPKGLPDAFRLGAHALMADIIGDWRKDPSVNVTPCRAGTAWASGRIPAILDGEPIRLHKRVDFRFVPVAFRALAPPRAAPPA